MPCARLPDRSMRISRCGTLSLFDSRMHGRRSCIQHPKEDFLVIMADLRLGNGKLLVAWEADKIVGMAFTVMGDDTLYIKELLADTDAVQDTLLYEAAHIYKVQRMDYFIPSSADTCFGMARVIRAEELLKVFAHKYPASELYIHIEGDEAIQENNGYYTVRDGFCFRERVPEKISHLYVGWFYPVVTGSGASLYEFDAELIFITGCLG